MDWQDAFEAWVLTADLGEWATPGCAEHGLAKLAYCNGRDCGRAEMLAEVERLQDIVDKLPKDADDDPVEDCRSYFVPCSNGAIEIIAYLGPQCLGDSPTPYPWGKAHKTREAAEQAGEEET